MKENKLMELSMDFSKEASETGYWIELLYRTKYIDEPTFKSLSSKCSSLRVMLISPCKTAKQNLEK